MTAQEIFNKVYIHLMTQNKRAMSVDGTCVYLAKDGLKCAVGCLIDDKDVAIELNRSGDIWQCKEKVPDICPKFFFTHSKLLSDLQAIHDFYGNVNEWPDRLARTAESHGLKIPSMENAT